MSEIERAIECFKKKVWSGELYESEVDMYNAVIKVLRAELDREKNPLTCDGCKTLPNKYSYGVTMNAPCRFCIRGIKTSDYYRPAEPKGDPICTQD